MITTKTEMISALNNILNNFVFGTVLSRVTPEGGWDRFASKTLTFQGPDGTLQEVILQPLFANLSRDNDRKILIEEFEKVLRRALLSEGHEVLLAYCEHTNQYPLYKAVPWFQFARIIRNVTSHKDCGVLREWPNDLKKSGVLVVKWRGRVLEASKIGQNVELTSQEALQLFADQMGFATTHLA